MQSWGRQVKVAFESQINLCRREMKILKEETNKEEKNHFAIAKDKLNNLIAQEEAYWKQREKMYWLRDSDINSKFFHSFATTRKKMDNIASLTRDDAYFVKAYFDNLYYGANVEIDEIIILFPSTCLLMINYLCLLLFFH